MEKKWLGNRAPLTVNLIHLISGQHTSRDVMKRFVGDVCGLRWLFVFLSISMVVAVSDLEDSERMVEQLSNEINKPPPVIYTFYQNLEETEYDTQMTHEDDASLLQSWRAFWRRSGWEPTVLTPHGVAAKYDDDAEAFLAELAKLPFDAFQQMLFTRWIAMASVGGGWLADYDVFPLRPFFDTDSAREENVFSFPNSGNLTLYEAVAPSLVSGSAEAWRVAAWALLEDAKKNLNRDTGGSYTYWTDTLGLLNLVRESSVSSAPIVRVERRMLPGDKALNGKTLTAEDCDRRPFRNRWAVHFGPLSLQRGSIPPELRLPKHRTTVARHWLPIWKDLCVISKNSTSSAAPFLNADGRKY